MRSIALILIFCTLSILILPAVSRGGAIVRNDLMKPGQSCECCLAREGKIQFQHYADSI
jgi:hypothetical protein